MSWIRRTREAPSGALDVSQYPTVPRHNQYHAGRKRAISVLAITAMAAGAVWMGKVVYDEYATGLPHSRGTENGLAQIIQAPERQLAGAALSNYQAVRRSSGTGNWAREQPLGAGWTEYASHIPNTLGGGTSYDTIVKLGRGGRISAVAVAAASDGTSYVTLWPGVRPLRLG